MERPRLYIFGWLSHIGGADTKLAHLLRLLHRRVRITVVPNDETRLREREWVRALEALGVDATVLGRLPRKLNGVALSMSNTRFFSDRIAHRAKERGLRIVWSSEMMWHHEGEIDAVREGVIDHVLYVSDLQRSVLEPGYAGLPGTITGNYVEPEQFPFVERRHAQFAIGRLSRPAPEKYPEDFPVFYERLELPDTRFRVMAWGEELARKYRWHRWDNRWDLLEPGKETAVRFLQSLDLFVYPRGHTLRESWGRSTVEAMLTGAVPLVPRGHHLENLVQHGEAGFLCGDVSEWQEHARRLRLDYPLRAAMSRRCREHAETRLCNAEEQRAVWLGMIAEVLGQVEVGA